MEESMRKPRVLRSVPAQTSSSQEPLRSTADQAATATTSDAFADADLAECPLGAGPRETSLWPLADKLAFAFGDRVRHSFENLLYDSFIWRRMLGGPAPDRLLAQPRSFFPKSLVEAELIMAGR